MFMKTMGRAAGTRMYSSPAGGQEKTLLGLQALIQNIRKIQENPEKAASEAVKTPGNNVRNYNRRNEWSSGSAELKKSKPVREYQPNRDMRFRQRSQPEDSTEETPRSPATSRFAASAESAKSFSERRSQEPVRDSFNSQRPVKKYTPRFSRPANRRGPGGKSATRFGNGSARGRLNTRTVKSTAIWSPMDTLSESTYSPIKVDSDYLVANSAETATSHGSRVVRALHTVVRKAEANPQFKEVVGDVSNASFTKKLDAASEVLDPKARIQIWNETVAGEYPTVSTLLAGLPAPAETAYIKAPTDIGATGVFSNKSLSVPAKAAALEFLAGARTIPSIVKAPLRA